MRFEGSQKEVRLNPGDYRRAELGGPRANDFFEGIVELVVYGFSNADSGVKSARLYR